MAKKKSELQLAQEDAQFALNRVNRKINKLGECTSDLYKTMGNVQIMFDRIRNVPTEQKLQYEKLRQIRENWKQQAEKIEADYQKATVKGAGAGAAGAGVGVAVAALGPSAAMGVATTFGVASTGTAISSLHGIAATNAALAWLGGGALSAHGGGIAAGQALLGLAGPVGWTIAGVAIVTSGLVFWLAIDEKNRLEKIFTLISKRDTNTYKLADVELAERIDRIKDENSKLIDAVNKIWTFGTDYSSMTEAQQYQLISYLNLMNSTTQLLTNPILGLQPKYTHEDFELFIANNEVDDLYAYTAFKDIAVSLANFLYGIDMDSKDVKVLWKFMRKNKEMLKAHGIHADSTDLHYVETPYRALKYKYVSAV